MAGTGTRNGVFGKIFVIMEHQQRLKLLVMPGTAESAAGDNPGWPGQAPATAASEGVL